MKKITNNHEWSWIFSYGLGLAYGNFIQQKPVTVTTLPQAEPFFYFLPPSSIKTTKKISWSRPGKTYNFDFNPKKEWGDIWTPPPLKEYYKNKIISNKPIIVINNKHNPEWAQRYPFNSLSISFLEKFIKTFKDKYQIYYIRYDSEKSNGEYWDDVKSLEFNDYKLLENYPEVITIYNIMEQNNIGFNTAQLHILASSQHIITVNGGNAVLSAYFAEDVIIYGHPSCKSTERGIWKTNSWLRHLSNGKNNILGFLNEDEIFNVIKTRWL